jgi:uncharacterized protein (TIGR00645 family)
MAQQPSAQGKANAGEASAGPSLLPLIQGIILGSRWLLILFYGGLGLSLLIYAVAFPLKLAKTAKLALVADETEMVLAMLGLIDGALVASLIVMVMISGYENFVGRFTNPGGAMHLSWMGKLDASGLKAKLAASIVAISSIHLMQVLFNADHYSNEKLLWVTMMHLALVVGLGITAEKFEDEDARIPCKIV